MTLDTARLASGGPIQVFYTGDDVRLPVVDRAHGIYMWDVDGKQYLDGSSGPVVSNIGHSNKNVLKALHDQAQKVCFASRAVFENTPNREFAHTLVQLAGPEFDQAFIVSGGSEATEAAVKLARQFAVSIGESSRSKILARNPSYHGATVGALSVTGDPQSEQMFEPVARIMPKVPVPMSYRLPDGCSLDSHAEECAAELERTILEEKAETVLAFLIEPIGGLSTGAAIAPDSYYRRIREICTRYGVLLIFDEVMSGAGRSGTFLAARHWPDALPDLVTLAKGLGAGYAPLGAVLAPNKIVEPIVEAGGFLHGHTYSANPLSCAVGKAVLDEMVDQNLMANTTKMGTYLKNKLQELSDNTRIIGDVRGKGLLLAIEIVSNKATKESLPSHVNAVYRLLALGIENGLMLYTRKTANGAFGEWLMITPPLTITHAQIDELVELLSATVSSFEMELDNLGI